MGKKNLFLLLHAWWSYSKIDNVKSLHWGQVNGKQILFCFSPGFWFWQVHARGQKLTCFVFICFRFRGMQWWRLFDSLFGEVELGLNGKSGLSLHRWLSHSKRQCQVLLPKSSIGKKSLAFASKGCFTRWQICRVLSPRASKWKFIFALASMVVWLKNRPSQAQVNAWMEKHFKCCFGSHESLTRR